MDSALLLAIPEVLKKREKKGKKVCTMRIASQRDVLVECHAGARGRSGQRVVRGAAHDRRSVFLVGLVGDRIKEPQPHPHAEGMGLTSNYTRVAPVDNNQRPRHTPKSERPTRVETHTMSAFGHVSDPHGTPATHALAVGGVRVGEGGCERGCERDAGGQGTEQERERRFK